MKEERMMILNMLNDGKITADEAVALLNAISNDKEKLDLDSFARGVRGKAADIAERAEPKMKKAAQEIKEKSVEVFGTISNKFKARGSQVEVPKTELSSASPEEYAEAEEANSDDIKPEAANAKDEK